jgi:hypothetical protein
VLHIMGQSNAAQARLRLPGCDRLPRRPCHEPPRRHHRFEYGCALLAV